MSGWLLGPPIKLSSTHAYVEAHALPYPDGQKVAIFYWSDSYQSDIQLWDIKTGSALGPPLKGHEKSVTVMAFSPDGRRLVSGSADKTLLLWDTDGGQPILP